MTDMINNKKTQKLTLIHVEISVTICYNKYTIFPRRNSMFKMKKIISLLLAVLMVMSTFTVMSAAVGAVTFEDTKLYFDLSSTGWELGAKDKVGFYVFSNEHGEELPWGGKKLNGTDEGDGIWSYDPAAKGMNIIPGEQYKIIFTGAGNQTYDLIFDTTCYGHVAYCDDTIYENPVDSSKQTRAAFWKDMDATKYGPVLQISSIGTVVGTCPEEGKTPVTIFEDFLTNNLANARTYMVDTGNITEQEEGYTGNDLGYYLEIDNYATGDEDNIYITLDYGEYEVTDIEGETRKFVPAEYSVKSDVYTKQQVEFIEKYMKGVFEIVYRACEKGEYYTFDENYELVKADFDNAKDTVEAVMDIESVVDMYLLYEIVYYSINFQYKF